MSSRAVKCPSFHALPFPFEHEQVRITQALLMGPHRMPQPYRPSSCLGLFILLTLCAVIGLSVAICDLKHLFSDIMRT